MNEFQRKLCDTVEYSDYIATYAEQGREVLHIDNYTYSVDGNVLTASITATVSQSFDLIMDTDSEFVMTYISGFGRATGATELLPNPAMLIQITDKSSGRTFFNKPSPMPLLAGQGGFPFLMTSPRIIKPRTTLTVTAISAQIQTFTGFYLSLHGGRIFYA